METLFWAVGETPHINRTVGTRAEGVDERLTAVNCWGEESGLLRMESRSDSGSASSGDSGRVVSPASRVDSVATAPAKNKGVR